MSAHAIAAVVAASLVIVARSAGATPAAAIAYATPLEFAGGYLVSWSASSTGRGTAHAVAAFGQGDGTYVDEGNQRVLTLTPPIVRSTQAYDACNQQLVTITTTYSQLVVRSTGGSFRRGTGEVVEIGDTSVDAGCNPGTFPFGSLEDAGLVVDVLDLALRPTMSDLGPGASIAGFSESSFDDVAAAIQEAQTVTFGSGTATFATTGHVVPAETTPDGWLVTKLLDGSQRAYTRLGIDNASGGEVWFEAAWASGAPSAVVTVPMVKPMAGAGFGGGASAARSWFDALFRAEDPQIFFDLYDDGTANQVSRAKRSGRIESLTPMTWMAEDDGIHLARDIGGGLHEVRQWIPIANHGAHHFAYESRTAYDDAGQLAYVVFPSRVNDFVDRGPAVPPTAMAERQRAPSTMRSTGMRAVAP